MIKKFEAFLSDTNKDFEHEDIVVAIHDTNNLKKGRKYRLSYPQPEYDDHYLYVHDLNNNKRIGSHKDNFVTEFEYETGEDTKKYNL